jgi:glyoxylase-like metal-dependent hydrolase (beta-lactamase superfamily II)
MNVIFEDVPESLWKSEVETDRQGRLHIDFNVVHIAYESASVLFDTGFGDFGATDPMLELSPGVVAGLEKLGVQRSDVTHVVLSHMHSDHVVGATRLERGTRVPAFPRARYYVTVEEWSGAAAAWQPREAVQTVKNVLAEAGMVELLAGETEIAPGFTVIPAPGETPGHAVMRVSGGGEMVYCVADLFHVPAECAHPDWGPPDRDRGQLEQTRRQFLHRLAAEDAWVIATHFRFPGIGKVTRTGEGFRWVSGAPSEVSVAGGIHA